MTRFPSWEIDAPHGFNGFCGVSALPHSSRLPSQRQVGVEPSLAGLADRKVGLGGGGQG